ncbi:putative MFS family arabinose efflux permease [Halopolyspora algeriensis]|uniref:Putative MFS family arabinose efflux permease n=1 Tax=Halopolyspora algeriensis TaxID=1500506 RepID=A0A368VHX6_9ACTN|nr:aromatic acid/H+ symport family MFS transporter [Halopolyspora algeriensis]RCW40998.1 putative MFS family arabinose efflux permease [Halopolyspora algeriensis]TQM53918.1 putative MFS family arabinose efflux permease [Halopolyspora algeriensis]
MTSKSRLSWPAALCWLTVMLEGFDLVALGAVGLALQDPVGLQFSAAEFTMVATISLVGVMIGAAFVTPLADLVGRRKVLIASVASFSLFTLLIPLSPNVEVFAALRLLAGIGLGACMPTALAAMSEYLPAERRARANTTTMTGYHCGAVAASLMALAARDAWQVLFVAGGAAGLILAGVMWQKLPETASVHAPAEKAEKVTVLDLLRPRFLRTTLAVWVGTFMGLLLVYGLNTWLPSLMETAGYNVSTSITLLFVLNAGGILGMFLAGHVGDTRGISRTILIWFGAGAVLLAALSIRIQTSLLLNAVIFLAGVFVFSAQVLVYAYIAQSYPERIRGSALGITSAVGRFGAIAGPLVTGMLVSTGVAYPWGFYFFAGAALLGLLAMAAAPWVSRQVGTENAAESASRTPASGRV